MTILCRVVTTAHALPVAGHFACDDPDRDLVDEEESVGCDDITSSDADAETSGEDDYR